MKIGINDINKGIYLVAIEKLERALVKEGYSVSKGNPKDLFDLYAVKDNERRIYELKIGKNKIQQKQIRELQRLAAEKEAKLFVTYVEQPRSNSIEYDGLDILLYSYLCENMPDELDRLSTHTIISEVSDVELNSVRISADGNKVEGSATLGVILNYGSYKDIENNDGDEVRDYFDFVFRVKIKNSDIKSAYLKFDLEHFYE